MKILLDENFNRKIVTGLLRYQLNVEFIWVQDVPDIYGAPDPIVLEWAAREGFLLFTHDTNTMIGFVYAQLEQGLPMPGVFIVSDKASIGEVIEDMLLILQASDQSEWENRVNYIPLR